MKGKLRGVAAPVKLGGHVITREVVPSKKLKPAKYNPRKMSDDEFEALKRSIGHFGHVVNVVARKEDGLVIGGHQGLRAHKALVAEGLIARDEVPVTFIAGLSDAEAKALNLGLNKISGEFDYDLLAVLLRELEGETLALSGFSTDEKDDILSLIDDNPIAGHEGMTQEELDRALAMKGLRLVLQFRTKSEFDEVMSTLTAFGMAKLREAEDAIVKALRVAAKTVGASTPTPKRKAVRA